MVAEADGGAAPAVLAALPVGDVDPVGGGGSAARHLAAVLGRHQALLAVGVVHRRHHAGHHAPAAHLLQVVPSQFCSKRNRQRNQPTLAQDGAPVDSRPLPTLKDSDGRQVKLN